ncbi:MAG: hypothetical protein QGF59_17990, partial [Pirellulaceae bacterium]|nr:hypothetical protein [Pirellulaceae bacterium]
PKEVWEKEFAAFAQQAERAAARYEKAPPGDRREAVRYEALCRALERFVSRSAEENSDWWRWDLGDESIRILDANTQIFRHPWSLSGHDVSGSLKDDILTGIADMDSDAILFEVRHAFERGTTVIMEELSGEDGRLSRPPEVWKAPKTAKGVFAAIEARWRDQLEAAVADDGSPLIPSGVNNQVLSEGLREFVSAEPKQKPVNARVIYRDGSEADPFPLRALRLKESSANNLPILRVSLMSMRHPEMDTTVDAAWLRNGHVSLSRPAAETDQFVYKTSRTQLRELAEEGCVCLRVYQTGLEPAVVGFYRAVTEHLLAQPASIEVVPFYHDSREDSYHEGRPWATK